jgi:hypothetical protein
MLEEFHLAKALLGFLEGPIGSAKILSLARKYLISDSRLSDHDQIPPFLIATFGDSSLPRIVYFSWNPVSHKPTSEMPRPPNNMLSCAPTLSPGFHGTLHYPGPEQTLPLTDHRYAATQWQCEAWLAGAHKLPDVFT